jgi:hypothetical protein
VDAIRDLKFGDFRKRTAFPALSEICAKKFPPGGVKWIFITSFWFISFSSPQHLPSLTFLFPSLLLRIEKPPENQYF